MQCFNTLRDEPFDKFLLASCMIPGFFPIVNITDGNGNKGRFCDGGLVSNNPMHFISPAGMAGMRFVIDICPYTRSFGGGGVISSALAAVMKEQTRSTLNLSKLKLEHVYSEEHYGENHFYVIQPSVPLSSGLIPLGRSSRRADYALGAKDAELFLNSPERYWINNLNFDVQL